MSTLLKIVFIDDSNNDVENAVKILKDYNYNFDYIIINSSDKVESSINDYKPDLIVSEWSFKGYKWELTHNILIKLKLSTPLLIFTSEKNRIFVENSDGDFADFVIKEKPGRLKKVIKNLGSFNFLNADVRSMKEELKHLYDNLDNIVEDRTKHYKLKADKLEDEIETLQQGEYDIHHSETFFNTIIENLTVVVYIFDKHKKKITYANKIAENLFGYYREELVGMKINDLFIDEKNHDLNFETKDFENSVLLEVSEKKCRTKQGTIKIFKTRLIKINNKYGELTHFLGIAEDTTESKKIEKRIQKSEFRFTKIFRSSPIAIAIARVIDSTLIDVNQSYIDLLGYTREELISKTSYDLKVWKNFSDRENLIIEARKFGTVLNKEVDLITKKREQKTVLMSLEYMNFEDEPCYIFMANDVTDRRLANAELLLALENEKKLNILKTSFISMISHEFRTPLTTIMLSSDLLKRFSDQWGIEEKQKHYQRIQDTVLKMTQLMENVLTINRLESGKFELNLENSDLQSFCAAVVENIEFSSNTKVQILYTFSGENIETKIDENLLWLALSNLLSNAIKYSPTSSDVKFDVECSTSHIIITIEDHGIGIPEKDLPHLFESFFRASNVRNVTGYGIGLSIVKKCIEAHKGTISVESKENQGTKFIITIPIDD